MRIQKRDGSLEHFRIEKIKKQLAEAINGFNYDCKSIEDEVSNSVRDQMTTEDLQKLLIQSALNKTDVDQPNWSFVASKLFLNDLYHKIGKKYDSIKGKAYSHSLKEYIEYGIQIGKITEDLADGYDLDELNSYLRPERDRQFTFMGIRTLYDRYLIRDTDDIPIELPQHLFMGVSMFLAKEEKEKMSWVKKYYDLISKFEVMVATPTLSNARTTHNQLSSCFVGSTSDNIESIFDGYKDMALLSKFGGGIGWDYSEIRGEGSPIRGVNGASGGLIPFLKPLNDVAVAVDQLGTRKASINAYIQIWHWDLEDFIDLKKNSGEERRRTHDLFTTLWIPDLFMERVQSGGKWTLLDPYECGDLIEKSGEDFRTSYLEYEKSENIRKKSVSAKEVWKKILLTKYETGVPFLAWKDESNRRNQNSHAGNIRSSNLCVTGDTKVLTENGYIRADLLADSGENPKIAIDGRMLKSGKTILETPMHRMVQTSEKEDVYQVTMNDGSIVKCTGYHEFPVVTENGIEKKSLLEMDKSETIYVHKQETSFGKFHNPDLAFIMGLIAGDGTYSVNKKDLENQHEIAYIELFDKSIHLVERVEKIVHNLIGDSNHRMPHFNKQPNAGNSQRLRLGSRRLARVLAKYGFRKETKLRVPDTIFQSSKETIIGYLRGIYTTDGTVDKHKNNGVPSMKIRLTSISNEFLQDIRVLLSMVGIRGRIYIKRSASKQFFPDGKGGYTEYNTKQQYQLDSNGDNAILFREIIGFDNRGQNEKCDSVIRKREEIKGSKWSQRPEKWTTKIREIEFIGREPVYDLTSDEESHTVVFDGVVTGNCLEIFQNTSPAKYEVEEDFIAENKKQTMGNTAVCNLASINLSKINKKEDFERVVPIAIRMLDSVIDLNFYPIESAKYSNISYRPVGLGVMGEAQMLAEHGIHFGSPEHFEKIDEVMEGVSYNAILSSVELAKEKDIYPNFQGSKWSKGILPIDSANGEAQKLTDRLPSYDWEELREKVKSGIRNGYLIAVAPTSSISILSGTSQAIEPIYKRKWSEENLSGMFPVTAPNLNLDTWQYYKSAYDVEQLEIIKAGAVRQKWIDQGQSLNIFVNPEEVTGGKLHQIYTMAWKLGLKSTYYIRSKSPEVIDRDDECLACQ
jgi:ribonucleoside-diphosphate reductase alpha chain